MSHLMTTYKRLPVTFSDGQGSWLVDDQNNRYLDALTGIAVNSLGHNHPAVTSALKEQLEKLVHVSNIYTIAQQEKAGDLICEVSGMDRVFFCNSGAEANEGLIKLSRLHARRKQIENPQVIVMEGAFHGRTMATLAATGNEKVKIGFEPLMPGFIRVPYNDIEAIRALSKNPDIVAVLLETVQGEGGVLIADLPYLRDVRNICNENNWLMMIDEIQTGLCRTGKWFGFQHADITPDAISMAKALGNGIPIGAFAARGVAATYFHPGQHGTTFGGSPFACRAVIAVIETMKKENMAEKAARASQLLADQLTKALSHLSGIKTIRHFGMMVGIVLDKDCPELVETALAEKLLINVTAGNIIRLLPPLNMTDDEIGELASRLTRAIQIFYS